MAIVDIIIPLYNKEKTVARTIQSILDQTVTDWRLIVVDDGSTDDSLSVVRRFDDARIEIIRQENRGPGAARNAGIRAAPADTIAFLDADDQWYPWYLEKTLAAFDRHNVAFVGAMYEEWPEQQDMTAYWAKRQVTPGVYDATGKEHPRDVLFKLFFFRVWNTVVRRDVCSKYGGFYDEEKCLLGEDTVFFFKLIVSERFEIIESVAMRNNRQDSDLSNIENPPLDIFLQKPNIVLKYLSQEKRKVAEKALAYHAVRTAHHRARNGLKQDAIYLKTQFPKMRCFRILYYQLCIEIVLSRWMPYWVRFKCFVGPPVRHFLQRTANKK